VRSGATLMSACQGVDILGERTSRTFSVHALESPHLDAQHDVLVEDGALGQVPAIGPMHTAAPAATGRTRCRTHGAVSLHQHRCLLLDAANDTLARLGENAINYPDSAGHYLPEVRPLRRESSPPARASHKVRMTQLYCV
jgi:hypothetical protein